MDTHTHRTTRVTLAAHARQGLITGKVPRDMQSINGASLRVLDSSIERIVLKTFES